MSKRKIIFDTDPGIDDAVALLTLFNYEGFEVLGVTSVAGNKGISHTTDNASKLIRYAKKGIKVYRGAYSCYTRSKPDYLPKAVMAEMFMERMVWVELI
jgi:inosine-uridine nucleoside N-ribohydrolase